MLKNQILDKFPFIPSDDQLNLIDNISDFLSEESTKQVFLLKGYAGTGKTTFVGALVAALKQNKKAFSLMAPTGRAAKILNAYSKEKAFTIHKSIYRVVPGEDGIFRMSLAPNKLKNAVFIVDEASMINDASADKEFFASNNGSLMDDLFQFIFSRDNNKLILIGDQAQLPPVFSDYSPALNKEYLKSKFYFGVDECELKTVLRQEENSGIIVNATKIRNKLSNNELDLPIFKYDKALNVESIGGAELEDLLNSAYSNYGIENTVIICRSNKRANLFNQSIRNRILFFENKIDASDIMMVVKNNYHFLSDKKNKGFIANGELLEVLSIQNVEEIYGFNFADANIRLIDNAEINELSVKVLLDTTTMDTASLSYEDYKKLYACVLEDYMDIQDKGKRYLALRNDPYLNALQLKFAYSLTCHKTQGGQWDCVFLDAAYLKADTLDKEYLRWLYTAVTRAVDKLYLLNFKDEFFEI